MHCRRAAVGPLLHTLPCAQPRSCLAARGRHEVPELLVSSSTSSRGSQLTANLFSSFRSTLVSSLCQQNSPRPLPLQATRAPQQLRQELSNLLHPLSHALAPPNCGQPCSSSSPANYLTVSPFPWLDYPNASSRLQIPPPQSW